MESVVRRGKSIEVMVGNTTKPGVIDGSVFPPTDMIWMEIEKSIMAMKHILPYFSSCVCAMFIVQIVWSTW